MKIIFFGTPEFASRSLEGIIQAGYEVCTVVTRADKPKGRGMATSYSKVKETALKYNIELYQPETLNNNESEEYLSSKNADIFITAAYGRIFPKKILEIPPLGCINIHASLLPKLRGAAPINRAIMNGDTRGGVTIMYMDEGIDTGDLALMLETEIPFEMNGGEYYDIITELGRKGILQYLKQAEEGTATRRKQDHNNATHAPKIEKSDELINFEETNLAVYNKIRGLSPQPCAYTFLNEKRVKIHKAKIGGGSGEAGKIIKADKNGIEIACKTGSVTITELQPEGKKIMTVQAFLAGNKLI